MYELPQFNYSHLKKWTKNMNKLLVPVILLIILLAGLNFYMEKNQNNPVNTFKDQVKNFLKSNNNLLPIVEQKTPQPSLFPTQSYEQSIIDAVKKASPSVVSIVISKNLPVYEEKLINPFQNLPQDLNSPFELQIPQYVQKGTEKQEVGAGSGFFISEDGLILTNRHVVSDKQAEYTVFTNEGKKYAAKVLALDPIEDLAVVKVQGDIKFPSIALSDSSQIQIGQTAISIGNALGEFRNTVSVGVVSGLGRTISASGSRGFSETLEGIIQTDAAINLGNSGGPLLNSKGEVIGVNVATAQGAQAIGFAIPINFAKRDINQVIKTNSISYPFLGVRYLLIDDQVKQKYNLAVDSGAFVLRGENGEPAITKNSAAQKAGIKEKDIILELNGEKISHENSLSKIITKYNPGDKVTLKILRKDQEINLQVILEERT